MKVWSAGLLVCLGLNACSTEPLVDEPRGGGGSGAGLGSSGGSEGHFGSGGGRLPTPGVEEPGEPPGTAGAGGEELPGSGGSSAGGEFGACPEQVFASRVEEFLPGAGQAEGQERLPDAVLGPPVPDTPQSVVSLGNGGSIILSFGNSRIVDGPGVDFIVFENPIFGFYELATVSVSADGETWYEFPCTEEKQEGWVMADYGYCAGWRIVGPRGSDFTKPEVAGGDPYDLADLGVPDLPPMRYVRIVDRSVPDEPENLHNLDVFDLDALAVVHAICEL